MRGLVAFGLLIAAATCGLSVLVPEDLSTTDAIVLVGMALAAILSGIALGMRDLASSVRQHIVWDDLKEQKREAARRG